MNNKIHFLKVYIALQNQLNIRYNYSDELSFFTDQEEIGFGFSASKSSITPSCSASVPPSGQLRRARTANSLLLDEHAAVKSTYIKMTIRSNVLAYPRTWTSNLFSQPQPPGNIF